MKTKCFALLTLIVTLLHDASAQVSAHKRDSLAQIYAPRFHFSPSEAFFPTLPFGQALDGIDNNGDSAKRIDETDEIAPRYANTHLIDHRTLMNWYRSRIDPDRAALTLQRDTLVYTAAKLALQVALFRLDSLATAFTALVPRLTLPPSRTCEWDAPRRGLYDSTRTAGRVDSMNFPSLTKLNESLERAIACLAFSRDRVIAIWAYNKALSDSVGPIAGTYLRLAHAAELLANQVPTAIDDTADLYPEASRLAAIVADGLEDLDTMQVRHDILESSTLLFDASNIFEKLLKELEDRHCDMEGTLSRESALIGCKASPRRAAGNVATSLILDSLRAIEEIVDQEANPEDDEGLLAIIDSLGQIARRIALNQGPFPLHAEDSIKRWVSEVDHLTNEIGRFLRPPPNAAVFYAVSSLDSASVEHLWRSLRLDGQAWRRLHIDRYEMEWRKPGRVREFYVIEYYLYYLNDGGLEGHPHDLEKVFVFVPAAAGLADSIRILAGAGHSPSTPNNVLILTYPATLIEREPNFLVEFGGHSNAPDRLPYKTFQRGWDVNWNAGDFIWGTRDLQAVTGTGFLEDYDLGLTLPRHDTLSVTLSMAKSPQANGPTSAGTYTLIPLEVFKKLIHGFVASSDSTDLTKLNQTRHYWSAPWRVNATKFRIKPLKAAKLWLRPTIVDDRLHEKPARQHLPWMDQQRRLNQLAILKPYLYPPRPSATGLLSTLVVSSEPSKGSMRLGLSLGSSSILGAGPMIPGMLQPEILGLDGLLSNQPLRPVIGFRYERYYTAIVSWYLGIHWRMQDRPHIPDPVVATGGLSFMPLLLLTQKQDPTPASLFAGTIRFRVGIQMDMRNRPDEQVEPHFEIEFRPPHSGARSRSSSGLPHSSRGVRGPRQTY